MAERDDKPLHERLAEAESIVEALRTGAIDAVVGEEQVLVLRLREAEEALRRSEARYRGIVEDQADLVYRWDPRGQLTFANEAFSRFCQRSRDALVGRPVARVFPDEMDYARLHEQLASIAADRPTLDREHRADGPAGEVRWLHVTHRLILDTDGEPAEVQSVARDITERRAAQEQLRKVNAELEQRVAERTAQLQATVRELDEAEQRERRRLAEFLHDDLQQLLVASKISVGVLRPAAENEGQQQVLEQARDSLDRSIAACRSLASQLSAPALRTDGLVAALHWLADQMAQMYQLPVRVEADARAEPEAGHARDLLFAFIRELLLNVIKHARATQAWIYARRGDDRIELEVCDNGVGFDATDRDEIAFGLQSMEERLQTLDGGLRMDSEPGRGCRAILTLPASAIEE